MEVEAGDVVLGVVLLGFVVVIWRVLDWLWFRPKKLERVLRRQGLAGNPYRFFYGDIKDRMRLTGAARSKPLNVESNDISPRVLPFEHDIITKFGKKSFIWNGTTPTVTVMEPEYIEEIFLKNNNFRKPTPSPTLRLLLSGLAGYEGEKWAKHRRIMNPAFYLEKLKHMLPAMHTCCVDMINKWEALVAEKGSCELDVSPYLQNLSADVIARTAFGSGYAERRRIFELQMELANLVFRNSQSIRFPGKRFLPTKLNKRMKEIHKEAGDLVKGVIKERERAMTLGEVADEDLLTILLKANKREIKEQGNNKKAGMSIDDVVNECKLMYFVGQETTSTLLTWTMILLSKYPEWQTRAREEVEQVFGKNKPDYNGINHLKILPMILNESLRLYPPATLIRRENHRETKLGDTVFPPGIRFAILIILLHHDQKIWGEDALEFKPERFSEGIAKAAKKPASFIPFGYGPRICIGNNFALLEAKIALVMILQRFWFELSPSYTHAPCFYVSLLPQNGAHLILHKI